MSETPLTIEKIPLPLACSELLMSREQVMHRLNTGRLQGGQELGRWYVTRASIELMRATQHEATTREISAPAA